MIGSLEYVDEDEWTSAIDDIDRYHLSDKPLPFIPLPKAIKGSIEEQKESTCALIVMMVSTFSIKEMSVYTDPRLLIQVSKKFTFPLSQKLFDAIDIDESKCLKFRRDAGQIKLAI
jgi:hypothetical protein